VTKPELLLPLAAQEGRALTLTRNDGKVFVGVPVPTGEPLTYAIRTGRRGRPAVVHVDDVVEASAA
jgi:hypothetical protein